MLVQGGNKTSHSKSPENGHYGEKKWMGSKRKRQEALMEGREGRKEREIPAHSLGREDIEVIS